MNPVPQPHFPADSILALKEENARLKEEIAWLRGEEISDFDSTQRKKLKITRASWRLLRMLERNQKLSNKQIYNSMWEINNEPEDSGNVISVYICRLRKILTPMGIEIITEWGKGYRIDDNSLAKLRTLFPELIDKSQEKTQC